MEEDQRDLALLVACRIAESERPRAEALALVHAMTGRPPIGTTVVGVCDTLGLSRAAFYQKVGLWKTLLEDSR